MVFDRINAIDKPLAGSGKEEGVRERRRETETKRQRVTEIEAGRKCICDIPNAFLIKTLSKPLI